MDMLLLLIVPPLALTAFALCTALVVRHVVR